MAGHIIERLSFAVQDVGVATVKQLLYGVLVVDDDHVLFYLQLVGQVMLLGDDAELLRDVAAWFLRGRGQFVVDLHLLLHVADEVVDPRAALQPLVDEVVAETGLGHAAQRYSSDRVLLPVADCHRR